MPFNSLTFLFFFLIFIGLYYLSSNLKFKSIIIIAGSYFFYAYFNIFNLIYLILMTLITYVFANKIFNQKSSQVLLPFGISLIIFLLIFTKYSKIILGQFSSFSLPDSHFFNFIILPVGISFYSLQAISLLVDIQKGKFSGNISLLSIAKFLCFFPQSMAGPIHRATELIPQFSKPKNIISYDLIIGFKIMLWGYFCKLMVADKISIMISPILSTYIEQNGLSIFVASLLYSVQIYFDFWGYSLIAIGTGRILGFKININFNNPYSAKSFKDFWHRWHITLSEWMRDYVYIPLGGSKQKTRLYFILAVLVTFTVSGFWHGGTYNFILWGITHAILYLTEGLIIRYLPWIVPKNEHSLSKKFFKYSWPLFFFILLSFTWLIFRTTNFNELIDMFKSLINLSDWRITPIVEHYTTSVTATYLSIVLLTLYFAHGKFISRFINNVSANLKETILESIIVCVFLATIILFGDIGGQEFLYFKF